MGDLSGDFSRAELACPCCGELLLDFRLLDGLQELRDLAGRPVVINSGFRCPAHNLTVGGKPGSRHLAGQAADIRIPGWGWGKLLALARRVEVFALGGIGVYPGAGFIHLDVRRSPARWVHGAGSGLPRQEAGSKVEV